MLIIEEKIISWREYFLLKKCEITKDCVSVFFDNITIDDRYDIESALVFVKKRASVLLTSDDQLNKLSIDISDPNEKEAFRRSWSSLMPKLAIPTPSVVVELAARQLAAAAALGSLLGMLLVGGFLNLWIDMRVNGIILGGIIGAASSVYGMWYAAHSKTVRVALTALVGVSAGIELISIFSSIGLLGIWNSLKGTDRAWNSMNGAIGALKRLLVYIGIIALLISTRISNRYDEKGFRQSVEYYISQWIDYGVLLLLCLSSEQNTKIPCIVFDSAMARSITNLHATSADDLPLSAEAVLQEARRLGLNGLDRPPRFVNQHLTRKRELRWENKFNHHYKCFGLIEEGDLVVVEEEPVEQNGIIIDAGSVRKVRKASKGDE